MFDEWDAATAPSGSPIANWYKATITATSHGGFVVAGFGRSFYRDYGGFESPGLARVVNIYLAKIFANGNTDQWE